MAKEGFALFLLRLKIIDRDISASRGAHTSLSQFVHSAMNHWPRDTKLDQRSVN